MLRAAQKLIVNLTTGQARLEGRPNMIIVPDDAQKAAGKP